MEETKYKQTEIGLIPEEWECSTMQHVIDFVNGRAYKEEELLVSGKYKVLRVGNFFTNDTWYYSNLELPDDKYCYKGDLLYAWSASFGPQIWNGDKTIFHYHIWNVKYDPKVLYRDYLYYSLLYDKTQIQKATTGSTMVHVSMENMNHRTILLPPLPEQRAIASALTSVDNLIASLDKQIAKAQNVKQGAMQQLLTRLNIEDVTWKPLGDVVNFSDGFPFDSSSFRSSGKYAVIRISDLSNYNVVRGDKYIEYLPAKIKDAQILGGGEILIAMSGSTGKVGYNKGSNFVVNQRIAIIRNKDNVLRDYLKHILLNSKFEENCFKQGTGIQNNIGKDVILDYLIPYPSIETQHRIASVLTAIDDQISALEAKRKKYEMVKVGMMQQLLTGKIRLK